MAHYLARIETPMTAAEAFAALAEVTRFAEWDPGITRAVQVAGSGPGPDAAYDLTVRTGTLRYRVQEYDPPRRLVLLAEERWLRSLDVVTVEPFGAGSVVTYDADLALTGVLRLGDPLLGLAFRRIGDRAAAGLRTFLRA